MADGESVSYVGPIEVGVPKLVGWCMVMLDANNVVTRCCTSCGVMVASLYNPVTCEVAQVAVHHLEGCDFISQRPTPVSKTCVDCNIEYPSFMVTEFYDGQNQGYTPLCGICALDRTNQIHYDHRVGFEVGTRAEEQRQMAVAFRAALGKT